MLFEALLRKPDGEGLDAAGTVRAHEGGYEARVYAPAQKGPEGHVADDAQAHRLGQRPVELRDPFGLARALLWCEPQLPVAADRGLGGRHIGAQGQGMAGR